MSLILWLHNLPENDQIFCHDYDSIKLPEGSTCIHHSTDSKKRYSVVFLKIKSCVKIPLGRFNIIRFKIKL